MNVGQKIHQYLKDSGRTQAWLSDVTKISKANLSKSLSGTRKMTFEEYERICGALHVNVDKFLAPIPPHQNNHKLA